MYCIWLPTWMSVNSFSKRLLGKYFVSNKDAFSVFSNREVLILITMHTTKKAHNVVSSYSTGYFDVICLNLFVCCKCRVLR